MGQTHRSEATQPASPLVRVAALTARLLDVRTSVVTVVQQGSQDPSLSIEVDRDGASVDKRRRPGARAAAEVPLISRTGNVLGMLGVRDGPTRNLTATELDMLSDLGRIVADEVELEEEVRRQRAANKDRIEHELQVARDIADVAAAVRSFSALEEPVAIRRAVCEISLQLTGGDSATILSVMGDDMRLVQTASAGAAWNVVEAAVGDDDSPAAKAYRGGKPLLLTPDERAPRAATSGEPQEPMSTLWQPFPAGGRSTAAVLGIAWRGTLTIGPPRLTALTELIAAEATTVLERADLLAQLAGLARTDELTGLPNRRAIGEDLTRELQRARRDRTPLCVALLDLDFFKRFNDTNGHAAGDALLAEAAVAWRECLRAGSDTIGRYGGEEFLVVLPAAPDDAVATVDRLRALTPMEQTASAGIASWDGSETAGDLVARADVALYAAKARGRDRSEVAAGAFADGSAEHRLIGVFRAEEEVPAGGSGVPGKDHARRDRPGS